MKSHQQMARVIVTKCYNGLCAMQVCALENATDEEIIATCDRENPSGTELGWCDVIRKDDEKHADGRTRGPVRCDDFEDRIHFLVTC